MTDTIVRGDRVAVLPESLPHSVVDLVHRSVVRHPERVAFRWKAGDGWAAWTYREVWEQIAAASLALRDAGIGPGDRVIVLSRSRPEWFVADVAIQALGAVTCPIYPGDPPARMADLVRALGARFFVVEDAKLLARLESGHGGGLPPGRVVLFDAEPDSPHPSLATLAAATSSGQGTPERAAWDADWQAIGPDTVATIVHTIGPDGVPLGVVVVHRNLVHSFQAIVQALPIGPADTVLSVLPMSHMFERGAGILTPIGVGATVAFAERQIERWAADMAEVRPTLMASIPLFFDRIAHRVAADLARGPGWRRALFGWGARLGQRHYENHLGGRPDGAWHRLQRWVALRTVMAPPRRALGGRLRYLMSGGAALSEATGLFFEAIGIPILEGYGLTETAPILTGNFTDSYRYGTVGRVVAGTELRLDPETGEILARGPQIMVGYLDRPTETARVLDADGWLRTGDVGAFDEAGRLRITGRLKNLLVLATGKNVAPAPIEAAIEASPHVRQAVLLGDDRDSTGVLLVPEGAPSPGLLRQEVERLTAGFASFERPRRMVALPRALDRARGELDGAGRPVRTAVIAHFPAEVAELFDRTVRPDRRDAAEPEPADAPPDARPESTVSAPS